MRGRLLPLLALLAALAGCGGDRAPGEVTVFVAASAQDGVRELGEEFTRAHGAAVRLSAGDSSLLATQISRGAPADLFLSAAEKWADFLEEKGLAAESRPLLGNRLVLVVPSANPGGVKGPADLVGRPEVRRVAVAGPTVPAGMYARQALGKLGLWDRLKEEGKLVSGANVRATLAYVGRGEAEAGVVYATDVPLDPGARAAYTFPAATHAPIRYPLVLLKSGAASEPARQFYDFLRSERAAGVFRRHGFTWLAGGAGK